jgi:hypothetical protein
MLEILGGARGKDNEASGRHLLLIHRWGALEPPFKFLVGRACEGRGYSSLRASGCHLLTIRK